MRTRWMTIPLLFLLVACASGGPRLSPAPASVSRGTQRVIRHVRVFDGEQLLPPHDVVITGEQISAVTPKVEVPPGTEEIDGTGKVLLPGFIDSHVHVITVEHLHQLAVFGVTSALDMMGSPALGARFKQAITANPQLADLRIAGGAATAPGGHGTQFGFPVPTLSTPSEAQAFVDARIAEGSDYIKLIYDDMRAYGLQLPTLDKPTLAAVIHAAHLRGKPVIAHIGSLQGARDAIEAGADGLAHTFQDASPDPELGAFVAAHRAFVIPTLSILTSAAEHPRGNEVLRDGALAPFLSSPDVERLGSSFHLTLRAGVDYTHAEESVRAFKAAGVPLLVGTDAPNPGTTYGATFHDELELLVNAGLTPTEALTAATARPAEQFHLDDRGRIRPGLRADLLLVDGDPTQDIRVTRRIVAVWIRGSRVERHDPTQDAVKAP